MADSDSSEARVRIENLLEEMRRNTQTFQSYMRSDEDQEEASELSSPPPSSPRSGLRGRREHAMPREASSPGESSDLVQQLEQMRRDNDLQRKYEQNIARASGQKVRHFLKA